MTSLWHHPDIAVNKQPLFQIFQRLQRRLPALIKLTQMTYADTFADIPCWHVPSWMNYAIYGEILGPDSTQLGRSDPLRCNSASRLRWASSQASSKQKRLDKLLEQFLEKSSKFFSKTLRRGLFNVSGWLSRWNQWNAAWHARTFAPSPWILWRPLTCGGWGAVTIGRCGNSYGVDRGRVVTRTVHRSGYSQNTIECLLASYARCYDSDQHSVLNNLYTHEQHEYDWIWFNLLKTHTRRNDIWEVQSREKAWHSARF